MAPLLNRLQLGWLWTIVPPDDVGALYSVALALGLRRGEALGLGWDDVDLDEGTLRVRVALQRIDGKLQLVEPKTMRSRRRIPCLSRASKP